jgi:hypothetical protein
MSIKRLLLRYVSVIVFRELLRTARISAETKLGAATLLGIALLPFGVVLFGSYAWWLLTGRRMPGPLGRVLPPRTMTTEVFVNPFPKQMPADLREALMRLPSATTSSSRTSA